MDTFFGIGSGELILILILAGLVLGPHRVQSIARWLGKFTAQMQGISRQFVRQINSELDATGREDLKAARNELASLREQVAEIQNEMKGVNKELVGTVDEATKDAKIALPKQDDFNLGLENSIAPAKPAISDEPPVPVTAPKKSALPKPVNVVDDPEI